MTGIYKLPKPLPELKIQTHKLEDLAKIIETSGFNLVREDRTNEKTTGMYGGNPFGGIFSFTLNQMRWLMYEQKNTLESTVRDYSNNSLTDVVFLSEKNDLIVKRNNPITQSTNSINVIQLEEFLKEYKSSNDFLTSKRTLELGLDNYTDILPQINFFLLSIPTFGVARLIYGFEYGMNISPSPAAYIGFMAVALVAGELAYLSKKDTVNSIRKEAETVITAIDNKIQSNNYLVGQTALEYIDIKKR